VVGIAGDEGYSVAVLCEEAAGLVLVSSSIRARVNIYAEEAPMPDPLPIPATMRIGLDMVNSECVRVYRWFIN
jgi:hypothetical protein